AGRPRGHAAPHRHRGRGPSLQSDLARLDEPREPDHREPSDPRGRRRAHRLARRAFPRRPSRDGAARALLVLARADGVPRRIRPGALHARAPRRKPARRMMTRTPIDELERLMATALERSGATPAMAKATARALATAELDGIPSHGASRVPQYCGHVKNGRA